ncbi:flavin reductase family protein [Candidatus Bathyarchaeota archaeon]|nr:MAG: flavin reductase family protein [Candidatus Bathyarchaeota archaeon]
MGRDLVKDFEFVNETHRLMRDEGILLVAADKDGKPNAMTIGWGLVGTIWRKPFFTVAVRLSRYTHKLMEESGTFTVCLPAKGMEEILDVCGTKSGRDMDKFKELGLTAKKGLQVDAPYIAECPVHYECRVAYKVELKPGQLIEELEEDAYPKGNYHVLYFGQILGVYARNDAAEKLS